MHPLICGRRSLHPLLFRSMVWRSNTWPRQWAMLALCMLFVLFHREVLAQEESLDGPRQQPKLGGEWTGGFPVSGTPWGQLCASMWGTGISGRPWCEWYLGGAWEGWAAWQVLGLQGGLAGRAGAGGRWEGLGKLSREVWPDLNEKRWAGHLACRWTEEGARGRWALTLAMGSVPLGGGRVSQDGVFRATAPYSWQMSWSPPEEGALVGMPSFVWSRGGEWSVQWSPVRFWQKELRLWRQGPSELWIQIAGPQWAMQVAWWMKLPGWQRPTGAHRTPSKTTGQVLGSVPRRRWHRLGCGMGRGRAAGSWQWGWRWGSTTDSDQAASTHSAAQ